MLLCLGSLARHVSMTLSTDHNDVAQLQFRVPTLGPLAGLGHERNGL